MQWRLAYIGRGSRAPYGARGLKFSSPPFKFRYVSSRPIRGAWIEIDALRVVDSGTLSRAPYGARGLKFLGLLCLWRVRPSRAPYGARGLKYDWITTGELSTQSRAPYGARGLKFTDCQYPLQTGKSRPIRGAWIEIGSAVTRRTVAMSRPIRGAWIEIR